MPIGPDPSHLFKQATDAYRAGNLAQAAWSCRLILAARKDHFDALHLLAIVEIQQGRMEEARQLLRTALRVNSRSAAAHINLALAIDALDGPEAALRNLNAALKINPNDPQALNNMGNALWRLGRYDEALASLDRSVAIAPRFANALTNRGNVLISMQRWRESLASFDAALAADPADAIAWHNRANVLWQLCQPDEAIASFSRSLSIRPDDILVLLDRGRVLLKLDRHQDALADFDHVLSIAPDHPLALNLRGNALWRLKRLEEAITSYDKCLAIEPDDHLVLMNRGNALGELGQFDQALADLDRSIELSPGDADAHWNRSLIFLRLGRFEEGWREYEWRFKKEDTIGQVRQFSGPRWHGGGSLKGKTILLYEEQGLGDTIQFACYATLLARRGADVVLQVQQPLKELLAQIEGVARVVGDEDELPAFDCHCPLLSLPFELQIRLDTLPQMAPFLRAPSDRIRKWGERLRSQGRKRVAIAWAGRPTFSDDHNRSIGLAKLSELLAIPGVDFYSVQKELRLGDAEILRQYPHVVQLGGDIADFSDSAAILSQMDVVISSDTAVVHLAGAMGVPVWILLQYAADWRWLLNRTDSPWYPSARLYRQRQIGDWNSVIDCVVADLRG